MCQYCYIQGAVFWGKINKLKDAEPYLRASLPTFVSSSSSKPCHSWPSFLVHVHSKLQVEPINLFLLFLSNLVGPSLLLRHYVMETWDIWISSTECQTHNQPDKNHLPYAIEINGRDQADPISNGLGWKWVCLRCIIHSSESLELNQTWLNYSTR